MFDVVPGTIVGVDPARTGLVDIVKVHVFDVLDVSDSQAEMVNDRQDLSIGISGRSSMGLPNHGEVLWYMDFGVVWDEANLRHIVIETQRLEVVVV